MPANNVRNYREQQMMSKAELARKAGLSTLTIDRLEAGRPCRLDTKRKVLLALGLKVADRDLVFEPEDLREDRADDLRVGIEANDTTNGEADVVSSSPAGAGASA